MPFDIGVRRGLLAPAHDVGVRHDREHHRVVVAVVRALDLHDVVAAGRGARDPDRAHRRLGAGVREPHLSRGRSAGTAPRRTAPSSSVGAAKCVPVRRGALDRLDDLRVRVADDHRAEAAVDVDVLVAVDVPDLRAASRRAGRSGTGRRPGTTSATPSGIDCSARSYSACDTGVASSERAPCSSSAISRGACAQRVVGSPVVTA